MNWDIKKTNKEIDKKNFTNPSWLTVTKISKFTDDEKSKINSDWTNYSYKVEFKEKIFYDTRTGNDLRIFNKTRNSISGEIIEDSNVFYYFMFYLNRQTRMHFREKLSALSGRINFLFFRLSGDWNQVSVIRTEKARWDALGYKLEEDLIQENKEYVDQGISKTLRDARKNALEKDIGSNPWTPALNSQEKALINSATDVPLVQKEIARIREMTQKEKDRNQALLNPRIKVSELPTDLYNKIVNKGKIKESSATNQLISQNYSEGVLPSIGLPWQDKQANQATNLSIRLPIRLIDIRDKIKNEDGKEIKYKKVERIMPRPYYVNEVRNYAILSHFWSSKEGEKGEKTIKEPKEGAKDYEWYKLYNRTRGKIKQNTTAKDGKLYPFTYKSLLKSARALEAINKGIDNNKEKINYFWMDQLCIDQRTGNDVNNVELDRESLKFRSYYANSTLTLVSIQTRLEDALNEDGKARKISDPMLGTRVIKWLKSKDKPGNKLLAKTACEKALDILSIIMRSEWRFSAWAYKEGWLSKQTIFMFDDVLVDGRFLAMVWAQLSGKRVSEVFPTVFPQITFTEFRQKYRGKFTTPIGWAYEENKQPGEVLTTIRLNVALTALIGRRRGNPLDILKAVLPVLPYGHLVEIEKWKERESPDTSSNQLFQRALLDVMKVGAMNGYGDFLAWQGLGESWLPSILPMSNRVVEAIVKHEDVKKLGKVEDIKKLGNTSAVRNIIDRDEVIKAIQKGLNIEANSENGKIIATAGKNVSNVFLTNMVPRRFDIYCAPGANVTNITWVATSFSNRGVNLLVFKEHHITKIGDLITYTSEDRKPHNYFYRLGENNAIITNTLSKRKVTVNGKTIVLKGTKEALGEKQRWDGTKYVNVNNPTDERIKKSLEKKDLKLLVSHTSIWRSVKINNDGTEGDQVPIALLVEKDGNKYNRIDLVKLLDSTGKNPDTTLTSNQEPAKEYKAQIEVVWPNS